MAAMRSPGLNIYLILDGEAKYQASDGAHGVAGANSLLTFYAGINQYTVTSTKPLAIYQAYIVPAPAPLNHGVPCLDGVGCLPHLLNVAERAPEFAALFERLMQTLLNLPATWALDNAATSLELFSLIFQTMHPSALQHTAPIDKWQRILARLNQEETVLTPVQQLAAESGMSVDHFIRQFERITGHTPKQYLLQRHLWNARRLLEEGGSVKATAIRCGFKDPCYFSRAYKRYFGHAPTHAVRESDPDTSPPPLLRGVTPIHRHLLAPGVDIGIFSPYHDIPRPDKTRS